MSKTLSSVDSLEVELRIRLREGTISKADSSDVRMLLERATSEQDETARKHFLGAARAILLPQI